MHLSIQDCDKGPNNTSHYATNEVVYKFQFSKS